ncbi:MAG: sugar ABC transporter ATP-binding protein [Propionivibrio sp.]|uniref:sugar ABC transporter ATP-binding protein n=1 Tax=Propionivibrio sp. TaxID=2212460 RepID=UPI001B6A8A53|nr:sugar ABC transporter ATP-binding protein [Propionivibrio sp.]MBP7203139.1 sugar ABC transporter ATP-binding protein [Propionivibrio sp.]
MTPIVEIRNLNKSFPGVRALIDARFDLVAGEVHALMGENGAGKSTLMKVLAGVYQKDGGTIKINGQEVEISGPRAAQALGVGIIHQELNLMSHMSVANNIFIGREPRNRFGVVDKQKMNKETQAILDRLHLKLDPETLVSELTVAKQQMVEIAKALSFHGTKVLILDEPTAALNNAEIDDLFKIIRQLKEHGVGMVYISHKMDELKRISDRVTVMRDGQYIGTVPTAETSMDTIIGMMVGRQLFDGDGPTPAPQNAEVVLEVKNLNRGRVIKNVSFQVRKGEILGFAGLMGAGRTEVARAIFGADKIDSGEIIVHGQTASIKTPTDAVKHGIGYLSEDRKHFGLATGMDVEANIVLTTMKRFLSANFFLKQKAIRETALHFVKQLDIKTPNVSQKVAFLSGGNQQKVVIAKWLVRDCEVLFFDEPTRGIDVGAKSEIYKLLNTLAEQGRAIVMISSELPEVLRLSHRILVMCEGRITGELKAGEATQENIMQYATQRETTQFN